MLPAFIRSRGILTNCLWCCDMRGSVWLWRWSDLKEVQSLENILDRDHQKAIFWAISMECLYHCFDLERTIMVLFFQPTISRVNHQVSRTWTCHSCQENNPQGIVNTKSRSWTPCLAKYGILYWNSYVAYLQLQIARHILASMMVVGSVVVLWSLNIEFVQ